MECWLTPSESRISNHFRDRELAEQMVAVMNNVPGVVYRGHRDWSVSLMEMVMTAPGLKVLFPSGYSANAIHDSFVLHPGIPFLQKPFGPGALARKVREVLDRK